MNRSDAHDHGDISVPLGGVILGVAFLHEQLSWQVLAGGALIVASLRLQIGNLENSPRRVRRAQSNIIVSCEEPLRATWQSHY